MIVTNKPSSRLRTILDVASTIAIVVACAVVVGRMWGSRPSGPTPAKSFELPISPVTLEGATMRGDKTAPVGFVLFSEFQCPFCGRLASEVMPTLISTYVDTGKVLLAFRQFPLDNHRAAAGAAQLSICAESAGLFWKVHDAFFLQPTAKTDGDFRSRATSAGLGSAQIADCEQNEGARLRVSKDLELAKALGVRSTPTVIIGRLEKGQVIAREGLVGARPVADFERAVEKVLASSK